MESRGNVTGVPGGLHGPGNLATTDSGLHPHWARITGQAAGTNRYAHEQVNEGDYPGFAGALADSFGTAGTSDAAGYPAYEINGRTDVPTDGTAVVRVYPSGDLTYVTFQYGEAAAGGDCDSDDCDDLVGLQDDWCLKLSLLCHEGEFSGMDEDQFAAVFGWYEEYDTGLFGWVFYVWDAVTDDWVLFDMDWIGGSGGVVLTFAADGTPILTVGGSLTMFYKPCAGGAKFVGGPQNGFTGDATPIDVCVPNTFALKVECSCCPPDGWQGPGWYCVVDTGETCDDLENACVELLDADICDETLVICSGPYADQEECEGECVTLGPPNSACQSHVFTNATATISDATGACTCLPASIAASIQGTDSATFGVSNPPCTNNGTMVLSCSGGNYGFAVSGSVSVTLVATSSSPIVLVYDVVMNASPTNICPSGSFRVTITDP